MTVRLNEPKGDLTVILQSDEPRQLYMERLIPMSNDNAPETDDNTPDNTPDNAPTKPKKTRKSSLSKFVVCLVLEEDGVSLLKPIRGADGAPRQHETLRDAKTWVSDNIEQFGSEDEICVSFVFAKLSDVFAATCMTMRTTKFTTKPEAL